LVSARNILAVLDFSPMREACQMSMPVILLRKSVHDRNCEEEFVGAAAENAAAPAFHRRFYGIVDAIRRRAADTTSRHRWIAP